MAQRHIRKGRLRCLTPGLLSLLQAGATHLRVESQQRAQAQKGVLLLDVITDPAQRRTPAPGPVGMGH